MNIPLFTETPLITKGGILTDTWRNIFIQLLAELNANASDEGLIPPSQSTANIALLDTSKVGALVYDSDTNELKVNINGTFKVVQVV
jgi:hypothetical protein